MGFISVFLLIYYHSYFIIDGRYIHNETVDSLALLEGYFGDYELYHSVCMSEKGGLGVCV